MPCDLATKVPESFPREPGCPRAATARCREPRTRGQSTDQCQAALRVVESDAGGRGTPAA
jgi:hypothetical protein